MKSNTILIILVMVSVISVTWAFMQEQAQVDIINDTFPEAQAELQKVLEGIASDGKNGNLEGLAGVHLVSPKFTKFSSRKLQRQTVKETIESETKHYGSIRDFQVSLDDVKIDVFGDVGIITYIPSVSYYSDDKLVEGTKRVTLVLVKTEDGWKIVHEHGSRAK